MFRKLAELANELDIAGYYKYADRIDGFLRKRASPDRLHQGFKEHLMGAQLYAVDDGKVHRESFPDMQLALDAGAKYIGPGNYVQIKAFYTSPAVEAGKKGASDAEIQAIIDSDESDPFEAEEIWESRNGSEWKYTYLVKAHTYHGDGAWQMSSWGSALWPEKTASVSRLPEEFCDTIDYSELAVGDLSGGSYKKVKLERFEDPYLAMNEAIRYVGPGMLVSIRTVHKSFNYDELNHMVYELESEQDIPVDTEVFIAWEWTESRDGNDFNHNWRAVRRTWSGEQWIEREFSG